MVKDHLEYLLEHLQDEFAFIDGEEKQRLVEFFLAQPKVYEELCDRINQLEEKYRKIDYLADIKERYGPSGEKEMCTAVPWETWREVAIFCLDNHAFSDDAVCFLRQVILKCREGWPVPPSQRQALWALSLLNAFDRRHEERLRDESDSAVETKATQAEDCGTEVENSERQRENLEPGVRG